MDGVNIKPPVLGDKHAKTNKGIITTSAGQSSSFLSFLLPTFLALDTVYETHSSLGLRISNLPNPWPFPFNQALNVHSCLSQSNPTPTKLTQPKATKSFSKSCHYNSKIKSSHRPFPLHPCPGTHLELLSLSHTLVLCFPGRTVPWQE